MTWIPLDVNDDADALRERFPAQVPDGHGWSRALDERFYPEAVKPRAWVQIESGNLVLVETIGIPNGTQGKILSRLWIAATDLTIGLPLNRADFGSRAKHGSQEDALSEAVNAAIEFLGLP